MQRLTYWTLLFLLVSMIGIGACDRGDKAAATASSTSMDVSKAMAGADTSVKKRSGAHGPYDPHAALMPDKHILVALQHHQEGRPQEAFAVLDQAIKQYSNNAELLSVRASLLLESGKASMALQDLEAAIAIEPHNALLHVNRAQAYRSFGSIEEALKDLEQALKLEPGLVAAHFNRGAIRFSSGEYKSALADFNACIEVQPDVAAPYFNRAAVYDAMDKKPLAIADLQRFIDLSESESWKQTAQKLLDEWQGKAGKATDKS